MIPPIVERWLIAGSLGEGCPLPPWLRRRVDRSPELQRYAASLRKIDSALSNTGTAGFSSNPGLAGRIAEALAHPRPPARRSLAPAWLGAAAFACTLVLVVALAIRGPGKDGPGKPVPAHSATLPTLPSALRRGPIVALINPVERPLNQQWRTVAAQTRRSVSNFIKNLPGLPTEDPASRLN